MTIKELILKNRSYRRYFEDHKISRESLFKLIDLARLSPSGGNMQALKFFLSSEPETNAKIFDCLSWAAYLKDWSGPDPGERPSAYIVILEDSSIKSEVKHDQGIASQSILLGAVELGLGGCIFGSVNRNLLRSALSIDPHLHISLVIALGLPKEAIKIEEVDNGDIRYWRDEEGVHHVPKRSLSDLII